MSIEIKKIQDVKKIDKPWGYEKWIADGSPNFKYALKEILFKSKFKSSIQFHEFKEETNYIQKGTGILHYSPNPINFEKFKNGGYSDEEINNILENLKKEKLNPGMIFHIKPGIIHRVEAITDLTLIESSTIELDDVFRINDEWGRQDGKIVGEHRRFILPSNFYISQIERIKFAKKYARGKILYCSYGINTQFSCSKLLLISGCQEIWHHDASLDENTTVRRLEQNNDINYEIGPQINQIPEKNFDCIISFEELQFQEDPKRIIEKYNKLLKDDGTLILSTMNKNVLSNFLESDMTVTGFLKNELLEIIQPNFSHIEIFSQRNLSKMEQLPILNVVDNILSKIKGSFKKILDSVDKKQNFYKLHLQNTVLQLREKRKNISKKVFDISYVPLPFDESHNPITFLLVCKK